MKWKWKWKIKEKETIDKDISLEDMAIMMNNSTERFSITLGDFINNKDPDITRKINVAKKLTEDLVNFVKIKGIAVKLVNDIAQSHIRDSAIPIIMEGISLTNFDDYDASNDLRGFIVDRISSFEQKIWNELLNHIKKINEPLENEDSTIH